MDFYKPLKKFFGFSKFKGLQEEVIKSIYEENNTFAIMPTGGGKSLCYQLPALMKEGTAIVVSPLIALMKNQVDAIRGVSENDSIAHVLNSSLNKTEISEVKKDIENQITKVLYVSPESLTKEEYSMFLRSQKISFVAIDEAHCISEWGHDFRPEYRKLKSIIKAIGNVPIICLTATATEKVQEDIIKTLGITDANKFKASFNRPNLFYEVRPKTKEVERDIIRFIKRREGKSGIIYCLSRKKVEETAQILQVNGIRAIPYHAGLDPKTRAKNQDMFLMEDCEVVVATIAFGMGIDKPDVRYVIHYNMPKSLESYYQETGRAGRDDGEGYCLAFYSYKDIDKLEKFMVNKPVAEQEVGQALLQEVIGYAETSISRRKYLLHYFGEDFDEKNDAGTGMDDNSVKPKKNHEAKEDVVILLRVIKDTLQMYKAKELINTLVGKENAILISHKTHLKPFFGIGKNKKPNYWMALIRQIFVENLIKKEIEQYGVIKITDKGHKFLEKPTSFLMTEDYEYSDNEDDSILLNNKYIGGCIDETLMKLLKNLCRSIAKKHKIPPCTIFLDASINNMALKYPITIEELSKIHGVGEGKAKKYGKQFVELIAKYVEENDILRHDDLVIKSTGINSGLKLSVIQNTDKKISLLDIAKSKGLETIDIIKEIEGIIFSGTKLNIDYLIDEILDEEQQEDIYSYFTESDSDKIQDALDEFKGEYEEEELRLMRIKFISDEVS